MSDVKKFTGFIAIDGSTHVSLKSATDHSRNVKIQRVLVEKFGNYHVMDSQRTYHEQEGEEVNLAEFIYANRELILFALNQEVLTRKKRTPKVAKTAAEAVEPVAEAV